MSTTEYTLPHALCQYPRFARLHADLAEFYLDLAQQHLDDEISFRYWFWCAVTSFTCSEVLLRKVVPMN